MLPVSQRTNFDKKDSFNIFSMTDSFVNTNLGNFSDVESVHSHECVSDCFCHWFRSVSSSKSSLVGFLEGQNISRFVYISTMTFSF